MEWLLRPKPVAPGNAENQADIIAATWMARLDRDGTSEEQEPELQAWLAKSSQNRGAFVRAQAAWAFTDCARALSPSPAHRTEAVAVVTRRRIVGGIAAGLIGAGAIGGLLRPRPAAAAVVISSAVGQVRRVAMGNGTRLILDADSRLEVSSSAAGYAMRLQRGCVWIDSKDAGRLAATAGALHVDCKDSAFCLSLQGPAQLVVTRGFVDLAANDGGAEHATVRLASGMRARTDAGGLLRVDHLGADAIDVLLAWQRGQIGLDGESVAEAVSAFNRHNHLQIIVADAATAQQSVVGWFRLSQPEIFAEAVGSAYRRQVRRSGNTIVIGPEKIS
jgi:transmembrane sensor